MGLSDVDVVLNMFRGLLEVFKTDEIIIAWKISVLFFVRTICDEKATEEEKKKPVPFFC